MTTWIPDRIATRVATIPKQQREYNPRKVISTWCVVCSSDVIHSVGGRPVYKPGRPPKGSNTNTSKPLTFCQKEKVVAPHGFSNCPVILKSCRLLVYMVTSVANHIVCYTDHLSDLDTIHPPSEITLKALDTYVQWLCGYLKHHKASGPRISSLHHSTFWTSMSLSPVDNYLP